MKHDSNSPRPLQNTSRPLGWSLLIGGLVLSLLPDSHSGIEALSERLQELGFHAGTFCVAGFLLLALGSVRDRRLKETASTARPTSLDPHREASSMLGTSDLQKLEGRLIAELDQKHEDLRNELHEMSVLIEANTLHSTEWPMAVGAELSSHQLRPAPRRLGPRAHTSAFTKEEEELDVSVEFEEKEPDETLLWAQDVDLLESGDTEDRLTGDYQLFEWDFPVPETSAQPEDPTERSHTAPTAPESETNIEEEPQLDRDNTPWFDWDEDNLV